MGFNWEGPVGRVREISQSGHHRSLRPSSLQGPRHRHAIDIPRLCRAAPRDEFKTFPWSGNFSIEIGIQASELKEKVADHAAAAKTWFRKLGAFAYRELRVREDSGDTASTTSPLNVASAVGAKLRTCPRSQAIKIYARPHCLRSPRKRSTTSAPIDASMAETASSQIIRSGFRATARVYVALAT